MSLFNYIIILTIIISPLFCYGQISEQSQSMSLGDQHAYIVDLPDTDKKLITSEWKSYLKEYGKVKRNRKAKEYYLMDKKIPSIYGSKKINIYMIDEDNSMAVFIDIGGQFIDGSHKNHDRVIDFLTDFIYVIERTKINDELEGEEKALKKMNKNMSTLHKDHGRYLSNIESAKKKIIDNEDLVEQNDVDQKELETVIDQQKIKIEEVKTRLKNVGK